MRRPTDLHIVTSRVAALIFVERHGGLSSGGGGVVGEASVEEAKACE